MRKQRNRSLPAPETARGRPLFSIIAAWIFGAVSVLLAAAGGALLRVRSALEGLDINTLMFYAWKIGAENLGDYENVRIIARQCVPCALAAGGIALFLWLKRGPRGYSISLDVQVREKKVGLPLVPIKGWILFAASFCFFCGAAASVLYTLQVPQYIALRRESVPIYREDYADARSQEFTFPAKKRNLIRIYMESMETTFADEAGGGVWYENRIPYLTELAENHISFSDMYQLTGTGYTSAGLVAQSSGIPLSGIGFGAAGAVIDQGGAGNTRDVWNLYDILRKAGYRQRFLCGSDGHFGDRLEYFADHGVETWDYHSAVAEGRIPDGYLTSPWGFEDLKLYAYAKEQITELAESGDPFSITLLTVDTHVGTYYICERCPDDCPTDYETVYACADNQLYDFIQWLQAQDFYENTTVVITGDHLNMDASYFANQGVDLSARRIYNCVVNPAEELPEPERSRALTAVDLFPTTLRAMGVQWEGARLGLGIDLFSGEPTLAEKLGMDLLNGSVLAYQKDLFDTVLTDGY